MMWVRCVSVVGLCVRLYCVWDERFFPTTSSCRQAATEVMWGCFRSACLWVYWLMHTDQSHLCLFGRLSESRRYCETSETKSGRCIDKPSLGSAGKRDTREMTERWATNRIRPRSRRSSRSGASQCLTSTRFLYLVLFDSLGWLWYLFDRQNMRRVFRSTCCTDRNVYDVSSCRTHRRSVSLTRWSA